jgi:beta-N-acetylhexosaminidase
MTGMLSARTHASGEAMVWRETLLAALLGAGLTLLAAGPGLCRGGPPPRDPAPWGQLVIVGFTGAKPADAGVRQAHDDLKAGRAGGVIVFDRNIEDPRQLSLLMAHLGSANRVAPPFLAIDEEGGLVERLDSRRGFTPHPSAARVAASRSVEEAAAVFRDMAEEIASQGFNLNLGPVVDLAVNPRNPVVAKLHRSYGTDPAKVAAYADAFVAAHREAGVVTALKHWPGHGSSLSDSHFGIADVSSEWSARETEPFRLLIAAGRADMIMSGHLHHRLWGDRSAEAASLSRKAVSGALRGELAYDGVVITDDLQMLGALKGRRLDQAIVAALAAGNDVVLIGNALDFQERPAAFALAAIEQGLRDGRLERTALLRSVERVMRLKRRLRSQAAVD